MFVTFRSREHQRYLRKSQVRSWNSFYYMYISLVSGSLFFSPHKPCKWEFIFWNTWNFIKAKTKGRNGIVRLRKIRISSLLLNIFLFGKKSHNLWSHSFQNILSFKDFVYIWYEKIRPEWTEVVKCQHFQRRVSVKYLFITRKIFNISSLWEIDPNEDKQINLRVTRE